MDFIKQLPESSGFNSILVVVDQLLKWATFILMTVHLTSASLADLLIDPVFSQHGLPNAIVSDQGLNFT